MSVKILSHPDHDYPRRAAGQAVFRYSVFTYSPGFAFVDSEICLVTVVFTYSTESTFVDVVLTYRSVDLDTVESTYSTVITLVDSTFRLNTVIFMYCSIY